MDSPPQRRAHLTAEEMQVLAEERRKKVKEMYNNGASVKAISAELGLSNATVQGDLAKEGIHPHAAPELAEPEAEAVAANNAQTQRLKRSGTTQRVDKLSDEEKAQLKRSKIVKRLAAAAIVLSLAIVGYTAYSIIERNREQEAEKQMVILEQHLIELQRSKASRKGSWTETSEAAFQDEVRKYNEFLDQHPSLRHRSFMKH
jgi:IS30 family transposase